MGSFVIHYPSAGKWNGTTMKIWVLSDLHCELTEGWDLPAPGERPEFDVLVVAGDLKPRMERGVEWIHKRVPDRPVIYIAGNHEGYHADIDRTLAKAKADALGTNISALENETIAIGGVRFVCGTLWSDFGLFGDPASAMHAAGMAMNDYHMVRTDHHTRRLEPLDTLARHLVTRSYIDDELAREFAGPTVVVTHHAPHRSAVKRGHEHDILSAAYVSDLSELIERRRPYAWIYGHTHESNYSMVGHTWLVSNAKGYGPYAALRRTEWENSDFDPYFTIDVPS